MPKLLSTTLAVMAAGVAAFAHAADDFPLLQKDSKATYIVKNSAGANSSGNQDHCVDSVLTERKMRFFIKHAVPSTAFNYQRALILDDCTAEGFVRSHKGKTYRLTLDGATGWGALAAGTKTRYLYCERCEGILDKDFPLD
ncbi:hypothetical protein [Acidovorax sp. Leaf78]|uniref:hypothetical protein n=1 Tax=unclassified Acidovorax TaxID=2684926 RepID=UPI000A5F911A|nr:hypothetical protein [Acidovorax sp. Leaf78]